MTIAALPWSIERIDALSADKPAPDAADWSTPIDRTKWFLCETVTPLYYTRVYDELSAEHRLRYNQLTGLFANELIGFLESDVLDPVLASLIADPRPPMTDDLRALLARFRADEARHVDLWRRLNRASEPEWYRDRTSRLLDLSAAVRASIRQLVMRPSRFPVIFWFQLAQEERSIELARRSARLASDRIEPRYAAIYRAHLADEIRHVQLDWHLIDRYFEHRPAVMRRIDAAVFRRLTGSFFLAPGASTTRIIDRLTAEYPELKAVRTRLTAELQALAKDPDYHAMMYSRPTTPITFSLFDRFPEFHAMGRLLRSYEPPVPCGREAS